MWTEESIHQYETTSSGGTTDAHTSTVSSTTAYSHDIHVPDSSLETFRQIDDSNLLEAIGEWDMDDKIRVGINFGDLILDCRYAGRRCYER